MSFPVDPNKSSVQETGAAEKATFKPEGGAQRKVEVATPNIRKTEKGAELSNKLNVLLQDKILEQRDVTDVETKEVINRSIRELEGEIQLADLTYSERAFLNGCMNEIKFALEQDTPQNQLHFLKEVKDKLPAASKMETLKDEMKALVLSAKEAFTDYTTKREAAKTGSRQTFPVSLTGSAPLKLAEFRKKLDDLPEGSAERKKLEAYADELGKILYNPTVQKFERLEKKFLPGEEPVKLSRFADLKNRLAVFLSNIINMFSKAPAGKLPPAKAQAVKARSADYDQALASLNQSVNVLWEDTKRGVARGSPQVQAYYHNDVGQAAEDYFTYEQSEAHIDKLEAVLNEYVNKLMAGRESAAKVTKENRVQSYDSQIKFINSILDQIKALKAL